MGLPIKSVLGDEYIDYITISIPFFLILTLIEFIYSIVRKKKMDYTITDSIGSFSTGLTTVILDKLVPGTLAKSLEFICVIYIYKHHRLLTVDEDSKLASLACLVLVDFGYYWFHRLAHEINVLWSSHSTHHSSELYNLTTALRQNAFQPYVSWVFYLPLGFFMPPGIFFFHKQFNTISQFWIHTKYIPKLGAIEWIFNTPSHHRVHHGRNPKYLDKNYAGLLIVWDRMFGTFQEEEEEVFYGLVEPINSFDPTWVQFHNLFKVYEKAGTMKTFGDKMKAIFYGPGWYPGLPRLGDNNLCPIPKESEKQGRVGYSLPGFMGLYIFIQFLLVSLGSLVLMVVFEKQLGHQNISIMLTFLYISFTTIGSISSRKEYAMIFELTRLISFILYTYDTPYMWLKVVRGFYLFSCIYIVGKIQNPFKKQKQV
ncbi:SUR2-type hydroxylase/desaturase catalytic region-containing protein [Cavenderia fasciculata]|uniref:SUR2-type hydroxylase/desaturase catalytic region-containing protein n=1 Tax=Cavenderia fasciculata TaxID=261658 RepID=F4Q5B7_CACFS|nr:SUR2-type hydroxylase/desaturase catalytic region-containing protein [Cavenderia fasciculata]EGG17176.1 SUR2-type hydroxylase/desaturase catalytic region-containing protein [Cavenderia fasciculata]|eukprot:XP_004355660.1 SUR2-type hydroxylase/desaturase catalytic region-containing protein [Cavenderia fasciculata]